MVDRLHVQHAEERLLADPGRGARRRAGLRLPGRLRHRRRQGARALRRRCRAARARRAGRAGPEDARRALGRAGWTVRDRLSQPLGAGRAAGAGVHGLSRRARLRQPARATKPRLVGDRDLAAIHLTNPEREIFAGSGVTKLDLAIYYARVGDWLLPELLRRPVTVLRCPTGDIKDCFYQRHAFAGLPPGRRDHRPRRRGGARGASSPSPSRRGYLGAHPVRRDRVPPLGLPHRRSGAPGPAGHRPRPGREPALGAGLRRRGDAARPAGGDGLPAVPAHHRRQGAAPGHGAGRRPRLAAGEGLRRGAVARHGGRRARPLHRRRVKGAAQGHGSTSTICATPAARARSRPTRCAPGRASRSATPIDWDELRKLSGGDAFNRLNLAKRLETLAADPWDELGSSAVKITPKMRRDVGMKT